MSKTLMPYKFHPLHLLPGVGMVVLFIAGQMLMTGSMEQQDLTALRRPPEAAPPPEPEVVEDPTQKGVKEYYTFTAAFSQTLPASGSVVTFDLTLGVRATVLTINGYMDILAQQEPRLRPAILATLNDLTLADISGVENRLRLLERIRDAVNSVLAEGQIDPVVERAIFTSFIAN
ncbi:MAG: flagellar basal body-associated FliL family protein [Paracoccaceae bacterium]|nr:flagellar basal body-associated FliL family protein [Paracoccaceae bacterium]MDP5345038.1 flagellar basal body-associated FliL family protein [Paracoccaceae bacterium]